MESDITFFEPIRHFLYSLPLLILTMGGMLSFFYALISLHKKDEPTYSRALSVTYVILFLGLISWCIMRMFTDGFFGEYFFAITCGIILISTVMVSIFKKFSNRRRAQRELAITVRNLVCEQENLNERLIELENKMKRQERKSKYSREHNPPRNNNNKR